MLLIRKLNLILFLQSGIRIGFTVGIPLFDLLTREDSLDGFNPLPSSSLGSRLSPRLKKENVLKILLAALEEIPPPSLKEIAERLGYSSSLTLSRYFPEVCDQIVANYRQSERGKEKGKFSTKRLQEDDVIQSALEAALKENLPPSLTHIGKRLGYTASQAIRVRCPDLCKALTRPISDCVYGSASFKMRP